MIRDASSTPTVPGGLPFDATQIQFTALGPGAVARPVQAKERDILSVLDFYANGVSGVAADPTGVVDSTGAWAAAIVAAIALRKSGAAGLTAGISPIIDGMGGKYKVSSTLAMDAYLEIQNAIFAPTVNTFSVFSAVQQGDKFRKVMFVAGQDAIALATGNVDATVVDIDECEFMNQTVTAIKTDANSGSTLLNIRRGRFFNNTGATAIAVWARAITKVIFEDSWVEWSGIAFQTGDASNKDSHLEISGMLGVPISGTAVWINNFGFTRATKCRFGGETAATLAQQRSSVGDAGYDSGLIIEDCETNVTGKYLVEFYGIPKIFSWKRNIANTSNVANGFFFDASIGSLTLINDVGSDWEIDHNVDPVTEFRGTTEPAARAIAIRTETIRGAASLVTADKVLQIPPNSGAFGSTGSTSNTTLTTATNTFGAATRNNVGTSATYNGNTSGAFPTAFNGFAAGMYTVVYDIENLTNMPVAMVLRAADKQVLRAFKKGKHIVCIPTYYNTVDNLGVGYQTININNAQSVALGPMRIFSGVVQIDSQNTIVYGAAAPTTLQWEVGDMVRAVAPAPGAVLGWICTTAGTPGTWVPFGSVQTANAYTVTNPTTDRALNVTADTLAQGLQVLGTLIADLQANGVLK